MKKPGLSPADKPKRFQVKFKQCFGPVVPLVGNEAFGAWVRAWSWSCQYGTDGGISPAIAKAIAPRRVWARLVMAGMVANRGEDWELLEAPTLAFQHFVGVCS